MRTTGSERRVQRFKPCLGNGYFRSYCSFPDFCFRLSLRGSCLGFLSCGQLAMSLQCTHLPDGSLAGWEGRQSWVLNTCHKPLAQTSLAWSPVLESLIVLPKSAFFGRIGRCKETTSTTVSVRYPQHEFRVQSLGLQTVDSLLDSFMMLCKGFLLCPCLQSFCRRLLSPELPRYALLSRSFLWCLIFIFPGEKEETFLYYSLLSWGGK